MLNPATQRVIALVDMDCFYCQVETRLNPDLKGKPVAVVQYNQWKGGGIIAVNYEARDCGVTRYMRGDEAKEKCPDIILVSVPTIRGKADLSNYRDAGDEVAEVFSEFSDCVQRASIDEAYLDLTKAVEECIKKEIEDVKPKDLLNTFVLGYCDLKIKNEDERKKGLNEWLKLVESQKMFESPDYRLAIGAKIVEKMRSEIFNRTGFHCSAGIAHNKILAKLTAGLHKPNKQTILPQDSIPELYDKLSIHKVRNLGGKFGKHVSEKLSINYMSELFKFSLQELQQKFDDKTGSWLYNIARGIDLDPVTSRLRPESIGCCKNFPGKNMLTTKTEVERWLNELATEISERLTKDLDRNKRRAKLLTVSFYQESAMSRCGALTSYGVTKIVADALELLKKCNTAPSNEDLWSPPIKYLGLSASKFTEEIASVEKYFKNCKNIQKTEKQSSDIAPCNTKQYEVPREEESSVIDIFTGKSYKVNGAKAINEPKPGTSKSPSSFFLKFLNQKENSSKKQLEFNEKDTENDENIMWVSLSEVFPNIEEVEPDVVKLLPEPLQEKFKERLSSNKVESSVEEAVTENGIEKTVTNDAKDIDENTISEVCNECGKNIPLETFLEHMDYHAALKLYSEINKTERNTAEKRVMNKPKSKEENQNKRKKKEVVTPSKKIKSITSFFSVISKNSNS